MEEIVCGLVKILLSIELYNKEESGED